MLSYFGIYGEYGISVFATRDASVDELAQAVPLVRFASLTLIRVGALRATELRIVPTGRNPHHFTVEFDDLNRGVDALAGCEQVIWANPYHEG